MVGYIAFLFFRLAYLPYSLTQANLNAILLAENQATGKIKLQPDFDEETQKEILTCYLLPQQNFHTPSMGLFILNIYIKNIKIINKNMYFRKSSPRKYKHSRKYKSSCSCCQCSTTSSFSM